MHGRSVRSVLFGSWGVPPKSAGVALFSRRSLVRIPHTNLHGQRTTGSQRHPEAIKVRGGGRSVIVPVRTRQERATPPEEPTLNDIRRPYTTRLPNTASSR